MLRDTLEAVRCQQDTTVVTILATKVSLRCGDEQAPDNHKRYVPHVRTLSHTLIDAHANTHTRAHTSITRTHTNITHSHTPGTGHAVKD